MALVRYLPPFIYMMSMTKVLLSKWAMAPHVFLFKATIIIAAIDLEIYACFLHAGHNSATYRVNESSAYCSSNEIDIHATDRVAFI